MKKVFFFLFVFMVCGCIGVFEKQMFSNVLILSYLKILICFLGNFLNWLNWILVVLNDNRIYMWEEFLKLLNDMMRILDLNFGRIVEWRGVRFQRFGRGDFVMVINENGEVVSIFYNVLMFLVIYMDGKLMLILIRFVVSFFYGCWCNWFFGIRLVDFVNCFKVLGVYGEVNNEFWLFLRSFVVFGNGLVYLNELFDKVDVRLIVRRVIFIIFNGEFLYSFVKIKKLNLLVVFEGKFKVFLLGIEDLRGIRFEG